MCRRSPLVMIVAAALALTPLAPEAARAASSSAARAAIRLHVDATDAARHRIRSTMTIPVSPGPLTLYYPKWIPGEHSPTGSIGDLAGLQITAGSRELRWRRDKQEICAFHCEVPTGTHEVQVSLEHLIPFEGSRRMVLATPRLAYIEWAKLLLYPAGPPVDSVIVQATLRVPDGWRWASALPVAKTAGSRADFRPATLTTLIDSPVLTGAYMKTVRLAPDLDVPHELSLAGDSPEAIAADAAWIDAASRLVREARALFGSRHYRRYLFLVALTDAMPYGAVEHHESSANRMPERTFADPNLRIRVARLLPHELAHSWCGKYRRPAAMVTRSFHEPIETDLLWVYEGLADYASFLLATRSGLLTSEQGRGYLAELAAEQEYQPGRAWRPLLDTCTGVQTVFGGGAPYASWRRGSDFYEAGVLVWLEADARIRRQTGGKRSLDDFCARFFGGPDGGPSVKGYTLDELIADLNAVSPGDWRGFFDERVEQTSTGPPVEGIGGMGWRMIYADTLSGFSRSLELARKRAILLYSIGLLMERDGKILDVVTGMAAARAGLAPGMTLTAVNGRAWSVDLLRAALESTRSRSGTIEVLAASGHYHSTHRITYRGGNRHPQLIRDPTKPDYLAALMAPRARVGVTASSTALPSN